VTILDLLKADHEKVKALLNEILETEEAKQRSELFSEFKTEMTAHARSEEKVFYRAMEKTEEGNDEALEGFVEHEVVDRLIADLARSRAKDTEKWTARFKVMKELIEHHAEEEESEFFKTAKRVFDQEQLQRMAQEFEREKAKHGVRPREQQREAAE